MQPEIGHILPTLRIARKLAHRGHIVRFFGLEHFRELIELSGATLVPVLGDLDCATGKPEVFRGSISTERLFHPLHGTLATSTQQLWANVSNTLRSLPSDILLIDSGILTPTSSRVLVTLAPRVRRINVVLPDFRQVDLKGVVIPEIILCPASFELPARPAPNHPHVFCEPSVFLERPKLDFPVTWIDRSKLLIYCSFGSQTHLYSEKDALVEIITRAFAGLPNVQLLLAIGGQRVPSASEYMAPNVLLCSRVDQLQVLKHASLFISHGGLGSIKEAILAGVPTLILPFSYDQPINAQRIEFHRLGRSMQITGATSAKIRDLAFQIITDRKIHNNVERFRVDFQDQEDRGISINETERALSA